MSALLEFEEVNANWQMLFQAWRKLSAYIPIFRSTNVRIFTRLLKCQFCRNVSSLEPCAIRTIRMPTN